MKKNLFFTFFILFIMICSAFAADWVQIYDKIYLDTSSLSSYDSSINSNNNRIYSIWAKTLNNGTDTWKNLEKDFGKKIWYQKSLWVVNCTQKEVAIKSAIAYDLKENVINSYSLDFFDWISIAPETVAEGVYSYICTPPSYVQPSYVQNTGKSTIIRTPSGSKIKVKSHK